MKHIPNLKFDDFQKGLLRDRYCLPGESISGMFKRVALAMEMPETQEIMQKGLFLPNSPTLYNAGTDIGQLSACFVLPIYDSMESIYGTLKDTAIIHKTGGGTGFNFSNLRPNGDRVGSHGGIASGVVSFMRVYDAGTEAVKQGGKRRGANMGMLDMWHPDIEDFMASKEGDNALQNFNLSNSITDDFMHAQQHDKDWDLINPRTGDTWKTVSAKELWDKMIHYAWKRGDPGVYFRDAVERANPTPELGDLRCCNPCVSGDTKVLTKEGYIPIINLIGREVEVWNGREWSLVKPEKTGEAQRLLKLTFTDGSSLRCTLYHPFYLETGEKVEAQDLTIGSSLEKWEMPVIEGSNFKLPEGMVPDWRYASGVRVCWLEAIIDKNRQIHADADTLRIIKENVLDITGYHCTLYADKGYIQIREPINMQVIGIEDGGVEDVYCFNEPIRHRGIFNGICTGQCGEVPLRDNESCNLGSINLSRMVLGAEEGFDYDLIEKITRQSVEFLNQVVVKNKYPLPQIEQATLETKKIGLGIMGWADALLLMGVYYDSTEALDIAEHVMKFVNDIAHDQSAGRNATVTTIAPTGSISIIANCSSGIEPNFGLYEVREQAGRTYHRKHPLVGQVDEGLFRLSHDVSPEYHIFHQATFQRFTDNAISKTINLPNNATEDMIAYAINLAHKLECKGTTIYRDKSKSKQVITKECEKCQA